MAPAGRCVLRRACWNFGAHEQPLTPESRAIASWIRSSPHGCSRHGTGSIEAVISRRHSRLTALSGLCSGFTIMEVMVAAVVMVISYTVVTQSFLLANRKAASSRLRTNARVIVERNINKALSVPFTSTVQPSILATTAGDVVFDDDGNGDGLVNLMVQDASGTIQMKAVLKRNVAAVLNPENADIRRITFSVTYTYRNHDYSYEMTTLRART